jgi:hypothetical protein
MQTKKTAAKKKAATKPIIPPKPPYYEYNYRFPLAGKEVAELADSIINGLIEIDGDEEVGAVLLMLNIFAYEENPKVRHDNFEIFRDRLLPYSSAIQNASMGLTQKCFRKVKISCAE